jgi:hypothetical protein
MRGGHAASVQVAIKLLAVNANITANLCNAVMTGAEKFQIF